MCHLQWCCAIYILNAFDTLYTFYKVNLKEVGSSCASFSRGRIGVLVSCRVHLCTCKLCMCAYMTPDQYSASHLLWRLWLRLLSDGGSDAELISCSLTAPACYLWVESIYEKENSGHRVVHHCPLCGCSSCGRLKESKSTYRWRACLFYAEFLFFDWS